MKFQRELQAKYWPSVVALAVMFVQLFKSNVGDFSPLIPWITIAFYAAVASYLAGDALSFTSSALVFGLYATHSSTVAFDLPLALAVSATAIILRMTTLRIRDHTVLLCLGTFATTIAVLSISDLLKPSQFITRSPTGPKSIGSINVGVALSGGGYRAAIFHAGVLQGLQSFDVPVSSIAAVSGGAIIASAYREGIQPWDFVQAVVEGKFSVYRKMLDLKYIYGYGLFLPGSARRNAQAAVLDDTILGGKTFGTMRENASGALRPKLMLIASDLANGTAVGFLPQGVLIRQTIDPIIPSGLYDNIPAPKPETFAKDVPWTEQWYSAKKEPSGWPANERTSTIVATSGAFPGAFEPYTMGLPLQVQYHQLTDGGITDNSAVTLLLDADLFSRNCADRKSFGELLDWRQDIVIASDGSSHYHIGATRGGVIGSVLNAIDAAYARVVPRPLYIDVGAPKLERPPTILLAPTEIIPTSHANESSIRTLLDEVTTLEKVRGKEIIREILQIVDRKTGPIPDDDELRKSPITSVAAINDPDNNYDESDIPKIRDAIEADALVFNSTPTLTASFNSDDAFHIYRLGWLIAALHIGRIHAAIAGAAPTTAGDPKSQICPGFGAP